MYSSVRFLFLEKEIMYIVFEGVVGTGKSTQSKKLADHLRAQHPDRRVELVREPGGTEIAEAIRTLVQGTEFEEEMHAYTDAYLYAAARAQLLHGHIEPLLAEWAIVIADRSFASSLAYQGHTQWLGIDTVWSINQQAVNGVMPDLIIGMDMPVELGYERTYDADGDKRERKKVEFFHTIDEWYRLVAADKRRSDRRSWVDATGSIEEVFNHIQETLIAKGLIDG